jgi:hypothetical protein
MSKMNIISGKRITSTRQKTLVIALGQTFGVTERHERCHSNSKAGRDFGMPESTVRDVIKHAKEIRTMKNV